MDKSDEKLSEPAPTIAALKPGSHHSGDRYSAEKAIPTEAGDVVVVGGLDRSAPEGAVRRSLKGRHLSMIALGGTLGTGIFLSSGSALASGGPVGTWLAFIFMGAVVYSMMVALGEMATLFPVAGGFTHYATRFVDPAMGFALGVNYWYSWGITLPVELTASAIVISYWNDIIHPAVWISVLFVLVIAVNLGGAQIFGEAEFWFSAMKILAIVGLIILGIILDAGGGPNHDPIGFRYWRNPGPFNSITINNGDGIVEGDWGKFLAFWSVFVQAAFSFLGTEIVACTVGEAQNPRKTVPKAIKAVFFRILFFYVLGIWVISVLVPSDDSRLLNGGGTATSSPFVIAINNAGIKGLPSVINAVILIAAWSAGNSDLYAASRTMYALALEGKMPRIFRRCTKSGNPIWAVGATALYGCFAYMNTGGAQAEIAFNWLFNISSITGLIAWQVILFSYLRFYYGLKKQGLSRDEFAYKAPLQPYLSWFGIIFVTLIIIFNGFPVFLTGNWDTSTFIAAYISIPIFASFFVGWKLWHKTKWVTLEAMDFHTGLQALDEIQEEEELREAGKTGFWHKLSNMIF